MRWLITSAHALVSTTLLQLFIFAEAHFNRFFRFGAHSSAREPLFGFSTALELRTNALTPQQPRDNQHQQPASCGHQLVDKGLLLPERQFTAGLINRVER